MATQPPVLNYRGKKLGHGFFDVVYPIIGLIVILANNWGIPNKQGLQNAENYLNGPTDIDDIFNIGKWLLHIGKQSIVLLVVWFLLGWLFDAAHNMIFGKKTKPNLIWKAIAYTCFLAFVYFFTK